MQEAPLDSSEHLPGWSPSGWAKSSEPLSTAAWCDLSHTGLGQPPGPCGGRSEGDEFTERLPGQLHTMRMESNPTAEPHDGPAGQSQRLAAPAWGAGMSHTVGLRAEPSQALTSNLETYHPSKSVAWQGPGTGMGPAWAWSWCGTKAEAHPPTSPCFSPFLQGPVYPVPYIKSSREKNQTSTTFVFKASSFVGVCSRNKHGDSVFQYGKTPSQPHCGRNSQPPPSVDPGIFCGSSDE